MGEAVGIFSSMINRLQRQLVLFWERHGIWLNLFLLITVSYLALAWVLRAGWWRESYRNGYETVGAGRPAIKFYRTHTGGGFDELHGWRLLGTVTDETNGRMAIVSEGDRRVIVRPGDSLAKGLDVVSIEHGVLIVRAQGKEQSLALMADRAPSLAGASRGMRVDLNRRLAAELFTLLHWNAVPLGGSFVGMRLQAPAPARSSAAFGLEPGDTLESVNGLPVTADDIRERLSERFRNDESVRLGVRREGRLVYLHYSLYD